MELIPLTMLCGSLMVMVSLYTLVFTFCSISTVQKSTVSGCSITVSGSATFVESVVLPVSAGLSGPEQEMKTISTKGKSLYNNLQFILQDTKSGEGKWYYFNKL